MGRVGEILRRPSFRGNPRTKACAVRLTFVALRVAGQVTRVLVDDNYRVKKGSLLVELDKEPYQVQLAIKLNSEVGAFLAKIGGEAQMQVTMKWIRH